MSERKRTDASRCLFPQVRKRRRHTERLRGRQSENQMGLVLECGGPRRFSFFSFGEEEKIAKGTAQAACRRLSEGSSFSVAAKRKKGKRRGPPHSKIQSDIQLRKTVPSVAQAPRISARG